MTLRIPPHTTQFEDFSLANFAMSVKEAAKCASHGSQLQCSSPCRCVQLLSRIDQAEYLGGTVPSIKTGAIGQFDLSSASQLSFQSPAGSFSIPYAAITSYEFSQEVTHHLGVAPAIAVGLIKKRQRQHFLRISYLDSQQCRTRALCSRLQNKCRGRCWPCLRPGLRRAANRQSGA